MAALISSSVASRGPALQTLAVSPPRCRWTPPGRICVSPHAHPQSLVGSTMNSSGMMRPIRRSTRTGAVDPDTAHSIGGNLTIQMPDLLSILSWPWMVGGAIAAAIPLYRRFRAVQDGVEKAAEAAIEVIDSAAEATERVAEEVAEAFPGNETLKHAASKIKAIADEIEEDVDKAEALLDKLDEIEEKMDSIVDKVAKDKLL